MVFEPLDQFVKPCPLLGGVLGKATLLFGDDVNESLALAFAIRPEVSARIEHHDRDVMLRSPGHRLHHGSPTV